jgi:hypothetical protein
LKKPIEFLPLSSPHALRKSERRFSEKASALWSRPATQRFDVSFAAGLN